jgi:hypothetical protein
VTRSPLALALSALALVGCGGSDSTGEDDGVSEAEFTAAIATIEDYCVSVASNEEPKASEDAYEEAVDTLVEFAGEDRLDEEFQGTGGTGREGIQYAVALLRSERSEGGCDVEVPGELQAAADS